MYTLGIYGTIKAVYMAPFKYFVHLVQRIFHDIDSEQI